MLGDMIMDKTILLPNVGNACRSLFGPVDHDEVRQTLRKELRVFEERSRERWNFDFVREMPLVGRWQYEPVTDVPVAYQMPQLSVQVKMIPLLQADDAETAGVRVGENDVAGSDTEEAPAARLVPVEEEEAPVADTTHHPAPTASRVAQADLPLSLHHTSSISTQTSPQKRKRQATITDFFTHKKARTSATGVSAKSTSS